MCPAHFGPNRTDGKRTTKREQDACPDCQKARQDAEDELQRLHTIDPSRPYGQHILLTCKHHPDLRWSTKNIDGIGARSIFFQHQDGQTECSCSGRDLILAPRGA